MGIDSMDSMNVGSLRLHINIVSIPLCHRIHNDNDPVDLVLLGVGSRALGCLPSLR